MPLPKGINSPEVRAAWIAERRSKLARYERLVAGGAGQAEAARQVGLAPGAARAMRHSIETMEARERYGRRLGANIDLGLAILSCVRKPGEELTSQDIAAWCDCSHSAIQKIERSAVSKLRDGLEFYLGDPNMLRALMVATGNGCSPGKAESDVGAATVAESASGTTAEGQ